MEVLVMRLGKRKSHRSVTLGNGNLSGPKLTYGLAKESPNSWILGNG